jgi:hypothetical protein
MDGFSVIEKGTDPLSSSIDLFAYTIGSVWVCRE